MRKKEEKGLAPLASGACTSQSKFTGRAQHNAVQVEVKCLFDMLRCAQLFAHHGWMCRMNKVTTGQHADRWLPKAIHSTPDHSDHSTQTRIEFGCLVSELSHESRRRQQQRQNKHVRVSPSGWTLKNAPEREWAEYLLQAVEQEE